jgi:hypothetical protein
MAGTKRCNKCWETKPLSDFYRATGARDGYRGECIDCAKVIRRKQYDATRELAIERATQWRIDNPERFAAYQAEYRNRPERKRKMRDLYYRRTFGISADDFDAMLEAQGGCCAICGCRPEREASLHVDHDHATGQIRGIVCLNCNQGLGKFGDDPAVLERAAAYLRG